jgi:hypothetical protein
MASVVCRNASVVPTLALLACACIGGVDSSGNERLSPPDAAVALKPSCPDGPPASDMPCDWSDLVCEYGHDPRRACRDQAICTTAGGGRRLWRLKQTSCPMLPATKCPPSFYGAEGMTCPVLETYCGYGDLACGCGNCRWEGFTVKCDGPGTWRCDRPNIEPGCPAGAPRLGSPCAPDGHQCNYDCGLDGTRLCLSGLWQPRHGGGCLIP